MRVTIVQYAGDYREAWERFEAGGKANYQAQRYSVGLVGSLAQRFTEVSVVCALTESAYDLKLPNNVRAIGAGFGPDFDRAALVPVVERTEPDRLILVTPMVPLLRWASKREVRTLTTLADSFGKPTFLNRIRHRRLGSLLNRSNVEWVANHGIGACLSLASIGVHPNKIIPWDWPPSHTPSSFQSRTLNTSRAFRLIYVGSVSEAKGVGDLLRAMHHLKGNATDIVLTIVGADHDGAMQAEADRLSLGDSIRFVGVVANEEVPGKMREADAVVVPSRHEYPEGLPLTIYEALAARTPIIASDHPMFAGAISDQESALIFRGGDPVSLADAISRLAQDADLYRMISENTEAAWQDLQLPVTWGDLIERWLADDPMGREWLSEHTLSSGLYDAQIAARRSPTD